MSTVNTEFSSVTDQAAKDNEDNVNLTLIIGLCKNEIFNRTKI